MKVPMRAVLAVVLALQVAGCGGYAGVRFPAVASTDMLTRVVANPNFRMVDGESFADAAMLYPTRLPSNHHTIPVGDYLLSRTVLALPSDVEISSLRLVEYRSACLASRLFAPQARCATKAVFAVGTRQGMRTLEVSATPDVGPLFVVGDIVPPFTWGDHPTEAIHAEARLTVDALQAEMRQAFAQLPRKST